MDYILAFVIGGIICVLSQILMDTTKLMPGRVMVILVCTGVILGAVGIYEPFMKFAGAGAFVPLTGFGYNLWKGIKDAVNEDGFLGLFRGGSRRNLRRFDLLLLCISHLLSKDAKELKLYL